MTRIREKVIHRVGVPPAAALGFILQSPRHNFLFFLETHSFR
jgi:hypothetical protein